jgi:anti-sigma B factor antagonist
MKGDKNSLTCEEGPAVRGIGLSFKNTDINEENFRHCFTGGGKPLDIITADREEKTVLSIRGRIDTATAPELEQAINRQIESAKRQILLDFSGVTYISSGGLRVLLATAKKLKSPGDRFGLCSLSPEVLKILKLAGFTSIFTIYPSEGEALAGW